MISSEFLPSHLNTFNGYRFLCRFHVFFLCLLRRLVFLYVLPTLRRATEGPNSSSGFGPARRCLAVAGTRLLVAGVGFEPTRPIARSDMDLQSTASTVLPMEALFANLPWRTLPCFFGGSYAECE